jgi:hypothetical protein
MAYQSHEVDANDWFMFTAKINMQSRGVGKDYNEVKRRSDYFMDFDDPDINKKNNIHYHFNRNGFSNLMGLDKMVEDNPVLNYLINTILKGAETRFYSDKLLPNKSSFWVNTARAMKEYMNVNSKDLSWKLDQNRVMFMTTMQENGIFTSDDIQSVRQSLFIGEDSLAKRIMTLKDKYKDNSMLKYLSVDFAADNALYDRISYDRNNLEDDITEKMQGGWVDLYNNPETKKDAEDLVRYIYLTTGGTAKSSGLQAIISPDFLIESGFADFYYSDDFKEKLYNSAGAFAEQYVRNYAKDLYMRLDMAKYNVKTVKDEEGRLILEVNPKDNGAMMQKQYVKYFDQSIKRHVALRLIDNPFGKMTRYEVLMPLGDTVTPEFDANVNNPTSIYKKNELKSVTLKVVKDKVQKNTNDSYEAAKRLAGIYDENVEEEVPQPTNEDVPADDSEAIANSLAFLGLDEEHELQIIPEGLTYDEWDNLTEEERNTILWQDKNCK